MTARDVLINVFSGGHDSQRQPAAALADQILGEHAHELAEKILKHSDSTGCMDCPEETCHYFAALIEPESYK